MRFAQILLLTCAIGSASTLTNSSFGPSDPNVIGQAAYFDTQSISVSFNSATDQVTAVIDLDFDNGNAAINTAPGGNQNLEPFTYAGLTLSTGDLFFYDPSAPLTSQSCNNATPPSQCVSIPANSSLAYAVVLDGGNGLATGDLYSIGNSPTQVTLQNAYAALSPTSDIYRPGQEVGVTANSGSTSGTGGTEKVCQINAPGCGTGSAQYQVTLSFIAPSGSQILSLLMNGQIGVELAAADCGNAVLAGTVGVTTPEPGTLGMIAAGIGMLGLGLVRRRRKS